MFRHLLYYTASVWVYGRIKKDIFAAIVCVETRFVIRLKNAYLREIFLAYYRELMCQLVWFLCPSAKLFF